MTSTSPGPETNTPKRLSREVQARIRRRANTLSGTAYDRYEQLLMEKVVCGAIAEADIEAWTPPELAKKP